MTKQLLRVIGIGIFCMLIFSMQGVAQNTKGDRPTSNRETKKSSPDKKVRTKKRSSSSSRAFKPGKKSKAADRVGSPLRINSSPRNVYPQSSRYVNNKSETPKSAERGRNARSIKRVSPRSASSSTRNVFPQTGRFVNHSSYISRKPPRNRRVVPRTASTSFTARRSLNSWARFPKPKPKRERAYTKDISGRKLRTKNFESRRPAIVQQAPNGTSVSSTPRIRNVYPQNRKFIKDPAKASRSDNVFSRKNQYVKNFSAKPLDNRPVSNRSELARLSRLQSGPGNPGRKRRISVRSASRPYIARKSPNAWAQFPRAKRKGEKAITTDLAGKPLRTKNYETQRPRVLVNPTSRPTLRGKQRDDKPYAGGGGAYNSRSQSGRAWRGDITNRRIRRNFTSKKGIEGRPVLTPEKKRFGMGDQGEGYTGNTKLRRRAKGSGVDGYQGNIKYGRKGFQNQGEEFTGSIKARRPLKGGGTASGKLWNNNRRAVAGRSPGIGARGVDRYQGNIRFGAKGFRNQGEEFSGTLKSRRPLKGGGTVSGKLWNNNRRAVAGKSPGIGARGVDRYQGNIRFGGKTFQNQGEEFSGSLKARRPLKGGGSVSGKLWNNNQRAVAGRSPGIGARGVDRYSGNLRFRGKVFNDQGEEYAGSIKARRPLKGGGSVSGKLWNNQQRPVAGRTPGIGGKGVDKYQGNLKFNGKTLRDQGEEYSGNIRAGTKTFRDQGEEFSGTIKSRRPVKGGGSVSGKLWNNNERPVAGRTPGIGAKGVDTYQGNLRFNGKTLRDQGEEYSGNIKAGQRVYNDQGEEFRGFMKAKKYLKNPNAAEASLKVKKEKTVHAVDGLQIKVRQPAYARRKNAPEGSLPGLVATKSSMKASVYAKGVRQYNYVRNPSSSDDALRVRQTGKAFARSTDFQGNIKMKKYDLFGKRGLHPDAQFVKTNKNNVAEEKDMLTNFKLWWARLFRKNDTQPDHLKSKRGKPRYDRGEAGLWYD